MFRTTHVSTIGMAAGSGSVTLLVVVLGYLLQRHKLEDRADTIRRLQTALDMLQADYTEIRDKELSELKHRIDAHVAADKSPVLAEQLKAIAEALRKNGEDLRYISMQQADLKSELSAVRAELKAKDGWIKGIEDKVTHMCAEQSAR